MGTEAQKLITVSLEKIANFRRRRREMSLHKNLLVTTVIHKARIAIMEETYYMYAAAAQVERDPATSDVELYGADVASRESYGAPVPSLLTGPLRETTAAAADEATSMDWEGMNDAGSGECGDADDDDKENLTPRGYKRHRTSSNDDESSQPKKIKWDSTEITTSDQEQQQQQQQQQRCCYDEEVEEEEAADRGQYDGQEEEEEDDTSHALRLVSVLMSGATASGSAAAALRIVRSFSNPDLMCSKQAKEGCKEIRTMMTVMGANRTPLAIAV